MDMPEVTRCFGMFPPKYACFLISLFGLGSGGVGIAGIILFGVVEKSVLSHFVATTVTDDGLKKVALMSIGMSSLMLLASNAFLFLGVTSNKEGCVKAFIYIILVMCLIIVTVIIAGPLSCFFLSRTCLVKKISIPILVLGYFTLGIYVQVWLYFMVVAHNLTLQM
ncbi:hypothetical protein K1T71_000197 [Dendrolimus kikuchii]|uniref:Uncharacterized protein n=1 Tax=Dendrolimus kikuchii TaxID=765133 RepID=A0ACC1DJ73_9NEOP|nr:hypothetical protein K1T71_000197 [Dendrolimus kikuchii]